MYIKHSVISVILASFIAFAFAGCQKASQASITTATQSTFAATMATSPTSPTSKASTIAESNLTMLSSSNKTATTEPQCPITKAQFMKAFNLLNVNQADKSGIQLSEYGLCNPIINEYNPDDGGSYILASAQYYKALGIIILFKKDGSEYIPLHMEKFNDMLQSVNFSPASIGTASLLEVTSLQGLGSGRSQLVQIFSLESKVEPDFTQSCKMSEVWEYQTVTNSLRPVDEKKGVYEYSHNYASYLVMPTILFPMIEKHDTPEIIVNDTHETFTAEGDEQKITGSKKKTTKQLLFVWDSNAGKFVEKK